MLAAGALIIAIASRGWMVCGGDALNVDFGLQSVKFCVKNIINSDTTCTSYTYTSSYLSKDNSYSSARNTTLSLSVIALIVCVLIFICALLIIADKLVNIVHIVGVISSLAVVGLTTAAWAIFIAKFPTNSDIAEGLNCHRSFSLYFDVVATAIGLILTIYFFLQRGHHHHGSGYRPLL